MSGPPPLTLDQADLLAAYGTWQVSWMLTSPDTAIPHVKGMSSGALLASWSWETTSKGIAACRGRHPRVDPRNGPDVIVTWSQIRAASKALPDDLLGDLAAARRRTQREWLRHFAPWAPQVPGGRHPWADPPPHWHQAAQDAERDVLARALDALTVDSDAVAGQLDLFGAA